MNTMKATTATAITTTVKMMPVDRAPCRPSSSVPTIAFGRLATMPAKMINDEPLPMPRLVICSPSHIRNIVPPVSEITVEMRKKGPGSCTMLPDDCSPTAIPQDWKIASTTVM